MSWGLLAPVAGFMPGLSEAVRREILNRIPSLSPEEIDDEYGAYLLYRDADQPTPDELRAQIDDILRVIRLLQEKVGALTPAASHLIDESSVLTSGRRVLYTLPEVLGYAEIGIARAQNRTPRGRRLTPRARLIRNLAWILHRAGLEVDAKPNGSLVTVTGILLQHAGEDIQDTRRIVTQAIKGWQLPCVAKG